MSNLFLHYNYIVVVILMMTGLYVVFASSNMIKKLVGLSVFQTSVFLLYISIGKVSGGQPPILDPSEFKTNHGNGHATELVGGPTHGDVVDAGHVATVHTADVIYSNPLPHVLILTAIVVGVATLAIGLALVVRIRETYGTIEEDEIDGLDYRYHIERGAQS